MRILQTIDLKKYYGTEPNITRALDGVNFSVNDGEFVAVVGTSGSGKSTLLHMMGGLDTPTSGTVIVRDKELSKMNDEQLTIFRRRNIGFIFQNYNLVPILNVHENIVLPVELDGDTVDQKFLDEIVHLLGLEDKLKNMPNNLSGGQQQRVALARILVYEPDVIMLDEPFSALDYYLKEQLQFQVREVLRGYTGDVLMVSHSRDEVYRFCEKSIILNRGQVAMKGETRAIFQKPENVTAARLTGCKNFSRIQRIGEYEVEALDWGLTFQTEEAVAAEHAYIGIRAHQFYPAHGSANEFTCEWRDTLCQPFEWDVLLRPVENAGAAGDKENALEREVIWWKVDYKQSDSLNQYQRGDRVRLGIAPGDIMLLKEG